MDSDRNRYGERKNKILYREGDKGNIPSEVAFFLPEHNHQLIFPLLCCRHHNSLSVRPQNQRPQRHLLEKNKLNPLTLSNYKISVMFEVIG